MPPPDPTHHVVVVLGALHLVLVDGDAGDLRTAGGGDGAHGPAHAAAAVQALLPGLEAQDGGDARLVCGLRLLPVLAGQLGGEVERLAPLQVTSKSIEFKHFSSGQ